MGVVVALELVVVVVGFLGVAVVVGLRLVGFLVVVVVGLVVVVVKVLLRSCFPISITSSNVYSIWRV